MTVSRDDVEWVSRNQPPQICHTSHHVSDNILRQTCQIRHQICLNIPKFYYSPTCGPSWRTKQICNIVPLKAQWSKTYKSILRNINFWTSELSPFKKSLCSLKNCVRGYLLPLLFPLIFLRTSSAITNNLFVSSVISSREHRNVSFKIYKQFIALPRL